MGKLFDVCASYAHGRLRVWYRYHDGSAELVCQARTNSTIADAIFVYGSPVVRALPYKKLVKVREECPRVR